MKIISLTALILLSSLISRVTGQAAYKEKYRPQFHFSPPKGWMNDPNGLVYCDGEYHLFYQHYPDTTIWGPMHWGHAVSKDMVHWKNLPIALYPDKLGYIFSGSAAIDRNNTSGFGTAENPPMIAIFTYHDMAGEKNGRTDYENQGIAYSVDKGRTWTKFAGNPVLLNPGIRDFRDPKLFWHRETRQWNVILSAHDRVRIYSSQNLKNWKFESEFGADAGAHGGVWECPDLFPLREEATGLTRWVMIVNIGSGGPNGGSGTQYFTGDYDGHRFTPDSRETSWLDYGRDNYAGVTWSDIPESDGRRLFLGWMSNWNYAQAVPTFPWRSAMTIPRELKLVSASGKYRVCSVPIIEMDQLQEKDEIVQFTAAEIREELKLDLKGINLQQCRLSLELEAKPGMTGSFCLVFENSLAEEVRLSYSWPEHLFRIDRSKSGEMKFSGRFPGTDKAPFDAGQLVRLDIFLDASSLELFADGGKLVMTNLFFPTENFTSVKLISTGGGLLLKGGGAAGLKSAW